jgi:hypothetical protein
MKNRDYLGREVNYYETKKDWNIYRENNEYNIDSFLHFTVPFISNRFQQDYFTRNKSLIQCYIVVTAIIYLLLNLNYLNTFITSITLIEFLIVCIQIEFNIGCYAIRFVYLLPELLFSYTVLSIFGKDSLATTVILNLLNNIVIGKVLFYIHRFIIDMWMEESYNSLSSEVCD